MSNTMRTRVLLAVLVLAVLAALVYVFRPQAVPVDVQAVDRGPLQAVVEGEGKTRVRERYVISATVGGRLGRVSLLEGDRISQGTIIARIDPLPLLSAIAQDEARIGEIEARRAGVGTLRPKSAAIAQAQARETSALADQQAARAKLQEARAQLDQALRDRERARKLYSQGGISRADLENSELSASIRQSEFNAAILEAESAGARAAEAKGGLAEVVAKVNDPDYLLTVYDAQLAATRADLQKLRDDASRTVIRAPTSGRILRVLQKSEQFVAAGTPIVEIGNASDLELVIELLSTDAVEVTPGAVISVDDGSNTWRYQGRVRYVEPSAFTKISALGVEEQRVNVIGDITGTHAGLGDAYRVEARIATWQAKAALRVPAAALFRCDDQWCVFSVEGGRARRRRVVVDHVGSGDAQLKSGLSEGDVVILHPSDKIADGVRVSTIQ